MKVYVVSQGMTTKSGTGDFNEVLKTNNKQEAIKEFNKIKHDKRGWANTQHMYLETILDVYDSEDDYLDGFAHDPLEYERIPF